MFFFVRFFCWFSVPPPEPFTPHLWLPWTEWQDKAEVENVKGVRSGSLHLHSSHLALERGEPHGSYLLGCREQETVLLSWSFVFYRYVSELNMRHRVWLTFFKRRWGNQPSCFDSQVYGEGARNFAGTRLPFDYLWLLETIDGALNLVTTNAIMSFETLCHTAQ